MSARTPLAAAFRTVLAVAVLSLLASQWCSLHQQIRQDLIALESSDAGGLMQALGDDTPPPLPSAEVPLVSAFAGFLPEASVAAVPAAATPTLRPRPRAPPAVSV
jgi:hypothetical protein